MSFDPVIIIAALTVGLVWIGSILNRESLIAGSFVNFGESKGMSKGERETLIQHYLSQQRGAYMLVWVAGAMGLLVGGIVLFRIVLAHKLDLSVLASGIGMCGDIWLGRFAWRFYRTTSQKLERFVT